MGGFAHLALHPGQHGLQTAKAQWRDDLTEVGLNVKIFWHLEHLFGRGPGQALGEHSSEGPHGGRFGWRIEVRFDLAVLEFHMHEKRCGAFMHLLELRFHAFRQRRHAPGVFQEQFHLDGFRGHSQRFDDHLERCGQFGEAFTHRFEYRAAGGPNGLAGYDARVSDQGFMFADGAALEAFGERLARELEPGSVLILSGPMGAGKTTLTKGLARGCGFHGEVTSPTYTYIHQYPTDHGPFVHVDAYRLEDAHKLLAMGLEELIADACLTVIEWGEGLLDVLEQPVLVRLEIVPEGRKVTVGA